MSWRGFAPRRLQGKLQPMEITRLLLKLLLTRQYQLTEHAIESMDEDGLTFNDILACMTHGRRRRSWPRQRKYEIQGYGLEDQRMRVVARLIQARIVRIITMYEVK